ncbi:MAG: 50S ribosomal protein L4 [Gemmatimonadota bacterium]|nr:50S ribosomal protein L4 [Gemmatimonadota bacterium]
MPDNQTNRASAYTALGTAHTEKVTLPEATFDGVINMPVMHQAVKAFMANQRQGNASTKIRKYVIGGNQKPWKQKGTGRARQGSTRAPQWVGGGTVFGPTPRPYDEYVPRQVRALAKKSALNARAAEGAIYVIDAFNFDAPHTKSILSLVRRLDVADKKVLVLTDGVKPNVFLSGRNIPNVHVMPYSDSSTYHILWSDVLLVEAGALGQTLTPIAEDAKAPALKAKVAAPAKAAKKSTAKAAKKSTTKASGGKSATSRAAAKRAGKASAAKKTTAKKSAAKKSTKKKGK